MSQPVASSLTQSILCYYINSTDKLQLAQMSASAKQSLEKLVFPGEKFLFEALPDDQIEIYTYTTTGISLLKTIHCLQLQVRQQRQTEH